MKEFVWQLKRRIQNQLLIFDECFSSVDDEAEGSTDDDLTSSDDEEIIVNQQPKNRKKQATDSLDGWDMNLWNKGDTKLQALPKFTAE